MTRVLGIEGTAWAASAAIYDTAGESVLIETDAYVPDSGGIHPREAAEHMQERSPGAPGSVPACESAGRRHGHSRSPSTSPSSASTTWSPTPRSAGTARASPTRCA